MTQPTTKPRIASVVWRMALVLGIHIGIVALVAVCLNDFDRALLLGILLPIGLLPLPPAFLPAATILLLIVWLRLLVKAGGEIQRAWRAMIRLTAWSVAGGIAVCGAGMALGRFWPAESPLLTPFEHDP